MGWGVSSSNWGGKLGIESRGGDRPLAEEEAENWGVTFQARERQRALRDRRQVSWAVTVAYEQTPMLLLPRTLNQA